MFTVGRLARRFGLSRSTLLYYHSIGVLRPSARSEANYRVYTEADAARLEAICRYRKAGLALQEIRSLLDAPDDRTAAILERRLEALNDEIGQLREQQRVVVRLLRSRALRRETRSMDKAGWVAILRATGLGEEEMLRWHVEFERRAPEAHGDFLESLGIGADEVARIRSRSRAEIAVSRGE